MKPPLGILGGTFDPVHLAHLALARAALERLGLVKVIWIPAGHPPHRTPPIAQAEDRLAMVRLAVRDEPRFVVDDSEAKSASPSYTVNTLERLRAHFGPQQPLVLLMGADAFRGLTQWHRWEDILRFAHLAVATRPGYPLSGLDPLLADLLSRRRVASAEFVTASAGGIHPFELSAGTVSATQVRALIAAGASNETLLALLPPAVLDYIRQHRLYRS